MTQIDDHFQLITNLLVREGNKHVHGGPQAPEEDPQPIIFIQPVINGHPTHEVTLKLWRVQTINSLGHLGMRRWTEERAQTIPLCTTSMVERITLSLSWMRAIAIDTREIVPLTIVRRR